ncbi:MAG TPA: CapA family protein [Micromonosporaceae bacterium]|jgi:poly-gamma-glutamate capsule biosynthesis protein CapA/YwtB (metallophosphatase superfamily)
MYDGMTDTGRRRTFVRRPTLVVVSVLAVLLGGALVGVTALAARSDSHTSGRWRSAPQSGPSASAAPTASSTATGTSVSFSATGDIIMANAPSRLPAGGGAGFFDSVRSTLAADVVMGNLEEPLTEDTGVSKCGASSSGCHQFRAPPSYAKLLRDAGFTLLNQANNHGNDYGPAGYRNTQEALDRYGLKHTGAPEEITVVEVHGVKVAVVGFSSYPWNNSLINIDEAKRVVREAAGRADLVVVQVHMGAEGSDKAHVRPGTEIFLGENRGDPIKFSHAVIDAGADLVVGHGPHVLRGMEFYKGRLIAYSLGNFAGGGGTLSKSGRLGLGGVLKVSLRPDGSWERGQLASTYLNGAGRPTVDTHRRGAGLVRELTRSDFPSTGARLTSDGAISPPRTG